MIDIHSHILWGLDDGAVTIDDSLAMLRIAAESGTTDIVATPHSNAEFEYLPERIAERIGELAARTGGRPAIHRGCDLHLSFDNIVGAIEDPARFSINGHRYILVEFSDLHISSSMHAVLGRLLEARLVPIITHPERNPTLQKKHETLEAWVQQGCLVQVTALSVTGGFGKAAQAAANRLLARGLVHAIASDAHDPVHRHPRLDQAFAAIARQHGRETAERLFVANPGIIIHGGLLPEAPAMAGAHSRRGWRFWRGSPEMG